MTFDELQKTWQSQQSSLNLSIDPNLLLREVKRNKRYFESIIFWRDVREVGIAFPLAAFFLYIGLKTGAWPLALLGLLVVGVGAFMIVDRIIQKKKRVRLTEPLADCINCSLKQVVHQIWLLKNVLWWYLLPPSIGIGVFLVWTILDVVGGAGSPTAKELASVLSFLFAYALCCFLLYWGIYYLNQRAVRKDLIPRKQELEQLLASLKDVGGDNE